MFNFIPKPYIKESISLRVASDKLELINKYCIEYNINRSEFINNCIDFSLSHLNSTKHSKNSNKKSLVMLVN